MRMGRHKINPADMSFASLVVYYYDSLGATGGRNWVFPMSFEEFRLRRTRPPRPEMDSRPRA